MAIGIGDMTVTSYINQPLQANIEVLQPNGLLESEADASGALDAEDPAETALDLALAYIDMGDKAGAADLLQTVLSSGDEAQREHAQSLLDSLE